MESKESNKVEIKNNGKFWAMVVDIERLLDLDPENNERVDMIKNVGGRYVTGHHSVRCDRVIVQVEKRYNIVTLYFCDGEIRLKNTWGDDYAVAAEIKKIIKRELDARQVEPVVEPAVEPAVEELEGPDSEIKTLVSNEIPANDSSDITDENKEENQSITDLTLIESNTGFATDLRLSAIRENIKTLVQGFDLDNKLINDLYWLAKDSYVQFSELDADLETYDYDSCCYKLSCQRFYCNLSDAINRELTEEEIIVINKTMCNFEE